MVEIQHGFFLCWMARNKRPLLLFSGKTVKWNQLKCCAQSHRHRIIVLF